jgi:hypothetical protein
MTNITEYLESVKSKNSGPFEICITLFFKSKAHYTEIVEKELISEETITDIYSIPEEDILGIYELDNINVIKFSMKRPTPQASFDDADLDGSQQHVPIKDLKVPQ